MSTRRRRGFSLVELAVAGADVRVQRRLAALVAELLPDEVELDLIELADDNLSRAVRERCQAFYPG